MLYEAYQAFADASEPMRAFARTALALGCGPRLTPGCSDAGFGQAAAFWELLSRAQISHSRPPFAIDRVVVSGQEVDVHEEVVLRLPFCDLLHFAKDTRLHQPKVLVVAPLSGHFATLLRATVETLSRDHDVYITDWKNARDIPPSVGSFGFDDFIDYVITALEHIGPGAHLLAVCQPCVQALAAVALMSEDKNAATPRSMTLMAGPIDPRVHPTSVNEFATEHALVWFEDSLIQPVPHGLPGAGRLVYPGFLQLYAFMSMNMGRHTQAHRDLYFDLAAGRAKEADAIKSFYDEYFSVLDLTAEFYLETVDRVFQDALLAKGELLHRGRLVRPELIRRTALLTVEGERDDICAVGQTSAAHDLCKNLRPHLKLHHLQPGAGHYGTFSGRKWNSQIYPVMRNLILATN